MRMAANLVRDKAKADLQNCVLACRSEVYVVGAIGLERKRWGSCRVQPGSLRAKTVILPPGLTPLNPR